LYYENGRPYDEDEIAFIKKIQRRGIL
jgi:hypothetical protein